MSFSCSGRFQADQNEPMLHNLNCHIRPSDLEVLLLQLADFLLPSGF